jgi:two-component system sensor histidine kinase BaeS
MADGTVETPADRVRAAGVIASETRRLERLVADLLDLARLDAHQFSLASRSVDARDIIGATVAGFSPLAEQWGVQLSMTPGAAVPVDTDPERLAQIVANLVENALKYAHHRVDDDGPGIPVGEQTRVFDRLYTARGEPGRAVGTGIGLAIVHELAGAMGGDADCRSLDGRGTRFVVRIPA